MQCDGCSLLTTPSSSQITTYHWPHEADYYPPDDDDETRATNPLPMTTEMRELVGYYSDEEEGLAETKQEAES